MLILEMTKKSNRAIILVLQARPSQPQHESLSVSCMYTPCVILKAIRAGVDWVWLARLAIIPVLLRVHRPSMCPSIRQRKKLSLW